MKIFPGLLPALFPVEKKEVQYKHHVTTNPLPNVVKQWTDIYPNIEVEAPLINYHLPKNQEVEHKLVRTTVAKKRKVERTEFEPGVITNQFFARNKQEVKKVAVNQKVERTEFESGVITNQLMSKEEIEKFFKQDMKNNIVYQPGVFEPGLVPNLFIAEEKQDVKKQLAEDAMRLSVLRIRFKSRANQFVAKKKEVEKMPPVTTNPLLAGMPPMNLLLAVEFAKEKEFAYPLVARGTKYDCDRTIFDHLRAWGPKH